jgi:hypothetical protein
MGRTARNNIQHLSKLEIGRIRSNLSRKATQLGNRLSKFAMGEEGIEMTPSQVKAAGLVLSHVLPSQAQTQIEDITPDRGDPKDIKEQFDELTREKTLAQLTPIMGKQMAERVLNGEVEQGALVEKVKDE